MAVLASHIINCCIFIAGGTVYTCVPWLLDFRHVEAAGLQMIYFLISALFTTTGVVGLVGYLRQSLPCILIYITGICMSFLVGCLLVACSLAEALRLHDWSALAVHTTLLSMVFAFALLGHYQTERELVRQLLVEGRWVKQQHAEEAETCVLA